MSYPKNIVDCAKGPSQGGLGIKDLRELATKMGIDTKGLLKADICKEIEKLIGKVTIPQPPRAVFVTIPKVEAKTTQAPPYQSPIAKLIGSGRFGCVYKPPLECKPNQECEKNAKNINVCNDGVSKLMRKEDALPALEAHKIIDQLDPDGSFHILAPYMCDVKYPLPSGKDKCEADIIYEEHVEPDTLLFYEFGGVDLHKISEKDINFNFLFLSLENIFRGIQILVNNGIIHTDIKMDNILVDDNYISKIIDFDFSRKMYRFEETDDSRYLGGILYNILREYPSERFARPGFSFIPKNINVKILEVAKEMMDKRLHINEAIKKYRKILYDEIPLQDHIDYILKSKNTIYLSQLINDVGMKKIQNLVSETGLVKLRELRELRELR